MPNVAEKNYPLTEPTPSNTKERLENRTFESLDSEARAYVSSLEKDLIDAKEQRIDSKVVFNRINNLFIDESPVKELADLCAILSKVPLFLETQERLDLIRLELKRTQNPAERNKLRQNLKIETPVVIKFNHQIRDFLLENSDYVTASQMKSLLSRMNKGVTAPFEKLINGFGAEVAVIKLLEKMPQISSRPASVEEDMAGIDLVVTSPKQINFDIKSGNNQGGSLGKFQEMDIDNYELNKEHFELNSIGKRKVIKLIESLIK